jgi:hypothetical protein
MYGTCKICGCTDNNACIADEFGACWWLDKTHEICSHCIELADDPTVLRAGINKGCCMCPFEEQKRTNPRMCDRCKKKDFTPEETEDLIRSGLGLFIHNTV